MFAHMELEPGGEQMADPRTCGTCHAGPGLPPRALPTPKDPVSRLWPKEAFLGLGPDRHPPEHPGVARQGPGVICPLLVWGP